MNTDQFQKWTIISLIILLWLEDFLSKSYVTPVVNIRILSTMARIFLKYIFHLITLVL